MAPDAQIMNKIKAAAISGITSSIRFAGNHDFNSTLTKMSMNLCPFNCPYVSCGITFSSAYTLKDSEKVFNDAMKE